MRIFKRSSTYWFELIYNGVRYRKSTRVKNQRAAGDIAAAFRTSLAKGQVGIVERKRAPAFDQAMKTFLAWSAGEHADHPNTAKRSRTSSVPLLLRFRKTPLDKITAADVEQYKEARLAEKGKRTGRKIKPATVNRELACLREMFNHAIKGNHELRNPVSKIGAKLLPEDNQKDRVLTFAEQRAYLANASELLADIAGIILQTGMRPCEVYSLRVAQVNLDEGYLRIVKAKTKAGKRQIELTEECRRILQKRTDRVGAGYLFPMEGDETHHVPKVDTQHTTALRASKVPKFVPYDLRHTFATRAAESGIDLVTLAAMMGHSRIQMVMRYAHPTQGHQTAAMEKLAAYSIAAEKREKLADRRREGRAELKLVEDRVMRSEAETPHNFGHPLQGGRCLLAVSS